ncbi:MAG: type II toxin-antitoxin system RelE/ParE family toxin [Candidatus Peribacteraceae bacterium]|nr:type II toxin-antitoxin system RelE/ParE family toxin [Candidatus Peribacteraceae bacterium]
MTKKYEKLLKQIPKKDRIRLENSLEKLFMRKYGSLEVQKLKGYEHVFRIRVGNYRIIYFDDQSTIILKAIQRRNEKTYSKF